MISLNFREVFLSVINKARCRSVYSVLFVLEISPNILVPGTRDIARKRLVKVETFRIRRTEDFGNAAWVSYCSYGSPLTFWSRNYFF